MTRMARFFAVFSVLFLVWSVGVAVAQATAPAPVPVDWGQKLFDVVMAFVMVSAGPIITMFMKTAPQWVRYLITGLTSVGSGALTGEFTSYPMTAETTASMSLLISMFIQKMIHTPRPEAVKAEQDAAAALKGT